MKEISEMFRLKAFNSQTLVFFSRRRSASIERSRRGDNRVSHFDVKIRGEQMKKQENGQKKK